MAQASENQMHCLRWLGIQLPKPQTQRGVTWKTRRKWSELIVRTIIDYIGWGNGAGPGSHALERLVLYQMARRLYEGRYVMEIAGEDETRYLVLQIYPKSRERVLWEAEEYGISLSEVDPFWFDSVAEGEPPDYRGHIQGLADLCDYRLADRYEKTDAESYEVRCPVHIRFDVFPLVTNKAVLWGFIRAMVIEGAFKDGDFLPCPQDIADDQRIMHKRGPEGQGEPFIWFKPVTVAEVTEVYDDSRYVRKEGNQYIVVGMAKVVQAA